MSYSCSSIAATFFIPGNSGSSPSRASCTSPHSVGYSPVDSDTPLTNVGDIAMGIMLLYQTSQPNNSIWSAVAINFGVPYFSISLSLNIILTLLIVARLALRIKNGQSATGVPAVAGSFRETIVAVFVESCALYAVTSLLFVVPWGANSHVADIFLPILAEVQVSAALPFPRHTAIFCPNLTVVTNRSLLHYWSSDDWQTRAH